VGTAEALFRRGSCGLQIAAAGFFTREKGDVPCLTIRSSISTVLSGSLDDDVQQSADQHDR
jgi:hypothetical protein